MARGYPDYFGQQQFPKYGPLVFKDEEVRNIADTVEADLIVATFKGRVYGGWIYIVADVWDMAHLYLKCQVDGAILGTTNVAMPYSYNFSHKGNLIFNLTAYYEEYKIVVATIEREITFEQSFKVIVDNETGGDIVCDAWCNFAQII